MTTNVGPRLRSDDTGYQNTGESEQSHPHSNTAHDLETLARWMDSLFKVPGLELRFGLDALLGLLPGAGDVLTSLASIYILNAAQQYGVSRVTLARMTLNVVIDLLIGALPFVGDVFDAYWKSNQRNVALLRRHLAATPAVERKLRSADRLFVIAMIALVCILTLVSIVLAYLLLMWLVAAIRGASN